MKIIKKTPRMVVTDLIFILDTVTVAWLSKVTETAGFLPTELADSQILLNYHMILMKKDLNQNVLLM